MVSAYVMTPRSSTISTLQLLRAKDEANESRQHGGPPSLPLASLFYSNNFFKQDMAVVTSPGDLLTCFKQLEMGERFAEHEPVIKGVWATGKRVTRYSIGGLRAVVQGLDH